MLWHNGHGQLCLPLIIFVESLFIFYHHLRSLWWWKQVFVCVACHCFLLLVTTNSGVLLLSLSMLCVLKCPKFWLGCDPMPCSCYPKNAWVFPHLKSPFWKDQDKSVDCVGSLGRTCWMLPQTVGEFIYRWKSCWGIVKEIVGG